MVVVAEVFALEVCSTVDRTAEVVSNADVSALVEEAAAVDSGGDVACALEVENSVVKAVGTVLDSVVKVDVAAAVEVVSNGLVVLVVVVRAGEVVSGAELVGREEAVAEVGLGPGAPEDICVRATEVVVFSAPSEVTCSGVDVTVWLDWTGEEAEVFRLEISAVVDRIVEVVTSGDVSSRDEETEAVDSDEDCTAEVVPTSLVLVDAAVG